MVRLVGEGRGRREGPACSSCVSPPLTYRPAVVTTTTATGIRPSGMPTSVSARPACPPPAPSGPRYYFDLNTRMRKEYEQRLEELKKSAEEEVDERLDASVKRILAQNRRMAEELKIHVQVGEGRRGGGGGSRRR